MVLKHARANILSIVHQTHLGQEMMVTQLCGKMNFDINKLVAECDPCQRHHRSHAKERVEVSHANMFNIWLGHTLHMDCCKYKNVIYVIGGSTHRLHTGRTDSQPVCIVCYLGSEALG